MLIALALFPACNGDPKPGDSADSLSCGAGTHEEGGECVADTADDRDTGDDTGGDTGDDTAADTGDDTAADSPGDTHADTDTDTDVPPSYTVCDDGVAPYSDIQDAVDDASDGDVITVCAGTYRSVLIDRVNVTLEGEDAATTTIDGGSNTALTVQDVVVSVSGFTLSGTVSSGDAAALLAQASTLNLADCVIADSASTASDHATFGVLAEGAEVTIERGIFEDNTMYHLLYARDGGTLTVRHSVFRNNGIPSAGSGGTLLHAAYSDLELANNLFYANEGNLSTGLLTFGESGHGTAWVYNNTVWGNTNRWAGYGAVEARGGSTFVNNIVASNSGMGVSVQGGATVEYNDAWDNSAGQFETGGASTSNTNLQEDPWFRDAASGDFTLDPGFSPCVDAGDPRVGYDDADGSPNDLGAFGGPQGDWSP